MEAITREREIEDKAPSEATYTTTIMRQELHRRIRIEAEHSDVCPGCGATDCTPATCPAYMDWTP